MGDPKASDAKAATPDPQRGVKDRQQTGICESEKTEEELERQVDEASEESFPASDPPAFTVTTRD